MCQVNNSSPAWQGLHKFPHDVLRGQKQRVPEQVLMQKLLYRDPPLCHISRYSVVSLALKTGSSYRERLPDVQCQHDGH